MRSELIIKYNLTVAILIALLVLLCPGRAVAQLPSPEITNLKQLRSLSREAASKGYPIKIQGTVLWTTSNGNFLFVHDGTDSVFARAIPGEHLARAGSLVEIQGTSDPGQMTPYINNAKIKLIGKSTFPTPIKTTIQQLLTGKEDAKWIETEGRIRYIEMRGNDLVMGLYDKESIINAYISAFPDGIQTNRLINNRVRIQGVCGTLTDANLKLVLVRILSPYWTNIVFLETNDCFAIPVKTISDVKKLANKPEENFVKISAIYERPDELNGHIVKDETGEISIYGRQAMLAQNGDKIEVVGFVEYSNNQIVMKDCLWKLGAPQITITNISKIKLLTPEEAKRLYPVAVNAVVTYIDPSERLFFVSDIDDGIYVGTDETILSLSQGDRVVINGIAEQGWHLPYIKATNITFIGKDKLPTPKTPPISNIISGIEDGNYLQISNTVLNAEIRNNKLVLTFSVDNANITAVIKEFPALTLSELIGAEVIAQGVCGMPFRTAKGEINVFLYVQNYTNLTILKKPETPLHLQPPLPIAEIITNINLKTKPQRIVVEGNIFKGPDGTVYISDKTGSIKIETALPYLPETNLIIRAGGFLLTKDGVPVLDYAVLLLPSSPEIQPGQPANQTEKVTVYLPLLTSIEQIRSLSPQEAEKGYPVYTKVVVTYCDAEWHSIFVSDGNTCIYVNSENQPIQVNDGDLILIQGFSGKGDFAPVIRLPRVTKIGNAPMPEPKNLPIEALLTDNQDSQYVKVSAVVRSAQIRDGHLYLELLSNNTKFRAIIPGYWNKPLPEHLVDSEVLITGNCGTIFNQRRQLIGIQLLTQNTNYIQIIKPAPADPFAVPAVPVSEILKFKTGLSPEHRVCVQGTVTYYLKGRMLAVQDKTGGIIAYTTQTNDIVIGDIVLLAGFPQRAGYTPKLEYAIFKKLSDGKPVEPSLTAPELVLSEDFSKEIVDGKLIRITGRVVDNVELPESCALVLQTNKYVFRAQIQDAKYSSNIKSYHIGDIVEVTGVCNVETDTYGSPQAFAVLMRSPSDIRLIQHAPWLTQQRLLKIIGGLTGIFIMALVWVAMLKRQVNKQTFVIKKHNLELEQKVKERTAELEKANKSLLNEIEERKRIEKDLERREQMYRSLFENSQDAIFIEDYEGRILDVNPAACQLHRMRKEEIVGKTVYELVPPEQREYVTDTFKKYITGELTYVEGFSRRSDGVDIPIALKVSRVDYFGKPALLFHVRDITDIKNAEKALIEANEKLERRVEERTAELIATNKRLLEEIEERKKAELALRESEERFRYIFEGATDLIQAVSPDGSFIYVNPIWKQKLGYTDEEIKKLRIDDIIHPDFKFQCNKILEKIVHNKVTVQIETAFISKEKKTIYVEGSCSPRFVNGELVSLNGIFTDITERKQAEEALKQSEERFSKAFNLSPVALAIASFDNVRIISVNDSFCKMFGLDKTAVLNKTTSELKLYKNPKDREKILQILKSERKVQNYKAQMVSADGKVLDVLISADIITLGGKECTLAVFNDITQLTSLEAQLRQSQKMEAVGRLAAGIAHDFNNFLTVIQGHTSLLLDTHYLDEDARRALDQILTSTYRATDLVKKLLAFSRQQKSEFKPLDLNKVLEDAYKMLKRVIGEDITLEFSKVSNIPLIDGDPVMIDQVIMNLAVNARDAMSEGGRLTFSTAVVEFDERHLKQYPNIKPGKYVRLSVSDTGCGMDETVRSKIFEPFFTTKEFGKGSGLGLAIVYGIVQEHNGWIEVDSIPGYGTTFTIYFPVSSKAETQPFHRAQPTAPTVATDNLKETTLLVVEDDPNLRFLVCHMLVNNGFKVYEAENAYEALEVWEKYGDKIDMLFTDLKLPQGTSGRELARQLLQRKPTLKVLYTSGYSLDLSDKTFQLQDGDNFIPKPYTKDALLNALNNCLKKS